MTMKRNDMQRMIIEGVQLLGGGQPAQEAFSSRTDCRSLGKERQFSQQRTAVLSARNSSSLGKERQFSRQGTAVPSGGNFCSLGRKPFFPRLGMNFSFPHFALRFLFLIVMILGGVLESGAATKGIGGKVTTISGFSSALGGAVTVSGNTVTLTDNINLTATLEIATDVVLDLGTYMISYSGIGVKNFLAVKVSSGTVTIKNGTIKGEHTGVGGYGSGLEMNSNGTLYLIDVTIMGVVSPSGWSAQSVRDATGLQYYKGTLIIVSGTFIGKGENKGTSGSKNALWSDQTNVIDFFKGSYIVGKAASDLNTKTIGGSITVKQTTYTINYDFAGGDTSSDSYVQNYTALDVLNGSVSALPVLSKNYYDFSNWLYSDGTNTKTISSSSELLYPYVQSESHKVTLKANWTKKTYTISYDENGGKRQTDGNYPTTYQVDDDYTISPVVRGDDKFGGWKDKDKGKMLVNNKVPSTAPRNLSLIAVWDVFYKITFNTGTSEVTAPGGIDTYVSTPVTLPTLTRTHYSLTGWKDPNNVVYTPGASFQGDKNVTLTAVWTPKEYTLSFNSQDGSSISPEKVTIETSNLSLTDDRHIPYRDYYDFKGWYADAACTGDAITSISNATGNKTLYAKWEVHTYTIAYEGDDWTKVTGGNYPQNYTVESGDVTIGKAQRNQDQFLFWIDTNTNSKLENEKLPTDAPRDLSLKAVWNNLYTLSFRTNDSNVTVSDISTYASETATLPSATRKGYEFKGWRLGDNCYQAGYSYQATANVTFEAVWEAITYTIKFIDNEVEVVELQQTYTIESPDVTFSSRSKDYWLFDGWKDESWTIIDKIQTGSTGNRTLTASWTAITYVLTYDYGYANKKETERYTYDDRGTEEDLKEASRTGYNFLGWFAAGATTPISIRPVDKFVKANEVPITITAHWELQTYPVTFYLNDGTEAALSEQTYRYSVEAGIPAAQMPDENEAKRTGYTFISWNTKKDGTGTTVTEVAAGTEALKFYAQWTPNEYNITYKWNGGNELSSAPITFIYNEGITLPTAEEMRKDHYTFAGWTREASSMNYVTQVEANQYAEDQIFYAQWTPTNYTIQFNTNGGTTVAELNYSYGSETTLKKSYRNGYTFEGWYADPALTQPIGEKVTSVTIPANSPTTLSFYAKWTPNQYKITYDTYGGKIQSGQVDSYHTGEEVMLPMDVKRDGFSFAGWYADDLLTKPATKIEAGDFGDKTFYATWSRGFSVIIASPKEGVIKVKQGDQAIISGTTLAKGTQLTISAEPTTSGYVLKKLVINGKEYTTSPQTVTMGEENLIVSAEFVASILPVVSAPIIATDPDAETVDAETLVKVMLGKTDDASSLYYALNDQQACPYTVPFMVDGGIGDTVTIRAIARREGYSDGIAIRQIVFFGRLHISFDLPAGVTATAPNGGSVVDAIAKGGTFVFKLDVDNTYFSSTDSMQVLANNQPIVPKRDGVYRLYNQIGDVKIEVKGLKARQCTVTLLQTDHGQITFAEGAEESSRAIDYGSEIEVQATADEDYKFSKWSTGSQQNPITIQVVSDTTISATFVNDYKAYQITLPEVEGVTAKPFTGYSTEVKRDGTFKFYLVVAKGYHEEQLVVRADGEELVKNKGGYALYHITKNICISVEGIVRDTFSLTLPPQVKAWKLETMEEATKASLYAETTLLLHAVASEGQRFLKWTDGSTENPRTATALDAKQLYPLFTTLGDAPTAKVTLEQTAGAGITGATSNLDVVNLGEQLSVKVVVLPAYSQSEVRLLANGQAIEPQVRLRAASEAKSYYYQVPVAQAEMKLKVEGLHLNQYQLTVAETIGGRVEGVPSGKVTHGDTVSLVAKPADGMTFVRWWDGNTLNPYPYAVTDDLRIRAYFMGESWLVDNESVEKEEVRVFSPATGGLWLELPVPQDVRLWDSRGRLLLHRFEVGSVRLAVPAGVYLLQCGTTQSAMKVVVH